MNILFLALIYIAGFLSVFVLSGTSCQDKAVAIPAPPPHAPPADLGTGQLQQLAHAITVRISDLQGFSQGSGILVRQQGEEYWVVTNGHVVGRQQVYRIQTADGQLHQAFVHPSLRFNGDLTVLRFHSVYSYPKANLAVATPLRLNDSTYAAGYPAMVAASQFAFTAGQVEHLLAQAFLDGYQIGYSNEVVKGMSGGPLLNRRGEVVGINGRHKFPLWGNNFQFRDGSSASHSLQREFERSSWAIPIQTFLEQVPQLSLRAAPFEAQAPASRPLLSAPPWFKPLPRLPAQNPRPQPNW